MIPVHLRGERQIDSKRCPHGEIKYCPLYHAAHDPASQGLHCFDAETDGFNGCAVDRGKMKYAQVYAGLAIACPRIVAECEWTEAKELRGRQLDRNIRLNGIH